MSKVLTTTSSNRPVTPEEGAIYYETDTHRLLIYMNAMWHVYNRDTIIDNQSGTDDLHYDNGIFADNQATHYIKNSPVIHLDSGRINGVATNNTINGRTINEGDLVDVWHDRTLNRHAFYNQTTNDVHANAHRLSTRTVGDPRQGVRGLGGDNWFKNTSNPNNYTGGPLNTAITSLGGDATLFWVIASNNATNYATPFIYNHWYKSTYDQRSFGKNFASGESPEFGAGYFAEVAPSSGPMLFMGRNSDAGNQIWRGDARGTTTVGGITTSTFEPRTTTKATGTYSIEQVSHSYDMTTYEIIVFDTALDITDMNHVKDYLQKKYAGMHDDYFPASGPTNPIVE